MWIMVLRTIVRIFAASLLVTFSLSAQTEITAVTDSATFTRGVQTYSLGSVFGTNLSGSTESARETPLPTSLAGVRLELCNRHSRNDHRCDPAGLIFVSPEQINFYSSTDLVMRIVKLYRNDVLILEHTLGPFDGWGDSNVKGVAIFQFVQKDCPIDKACDEELWRAAITDISGNLVTRSNPIVTNGIYTVWFTSTSLGRPFERFGADEVGEFDLTNFWTQVDFDSRDIWDPFDFSRLQNGEVKDRPYILYAGPSPEFPGLYQLVFQVDPNAVWVRRCTEVWLRILIRPDDVVSQSVPVPMCP